MFILKLILNSYIKGTTNKTCGTGGTGIFGNYVLYSSSFLHIWITCNILVGYGYRIQAHSKEQQNVILLRVINSTAYSGSNYSVCRLYKLPFPAFSAFTSFLQPTFQAFSYSFAPWPENAKGVEKRGESTQPFLLVDVGKAWWGCGLDYLVQINVFNYLWVYNCPHHEGRKDLLTQTDARDSESHAHLP